ncbi:hypothetical protein Droror1_Dr00005837 [Drosera rotundifolia]
MKPRRHTFSTQICRTPFKQHALSPFLLFFSSFPQIPPPQQPPPPSPPSSPFPVAATHPLPRLSPVPISGHPLFVSAQLISRHTGFRVLKMGWVAAARGGNGGQGRAGSAAAAAAAAEAGFGGRRRGK